MDILVKKKLLRASIIEKVKSLPVEEQKRQSEEIFQKIVNLPIWKNAKSVFAYASMPHEVDTWNLIIRAIDENKTIALPFYVKLCDIYEPRIIRDIDRDLKIGKMGIKEPHEYCPRMSLEDFDLIIVPGVAFSSSGYRLGRGKGYYDKMLARANGRKVGICFECQFVNEVPVENHDVKMNYIITPSLIVEF